MEKGCVFFNDTATTEIYTLSLHDARPILVGQQRDVVAHAAGAVRPEVGEVLAQLRRVDPGGGGERLAGDGVRALVEVVQDRKSTRLNSSHANISYAVFCLKKQQTYPCILL